MMQGASSVVGDTQQSPTFTVGDRSVLTGDSGSASGSEDEEAAGDDTTINGSKKRKRSHVKISYVWPLILSTSFCYRYSGWDTSLIRADLMQLRTLQVKEGQM